MIKRSIFFILTIGLIFSCKNSNKKNQQLSFEDKIELTLQDKDSTPIIDVKTKNTTEKNNTTKSSTEELEIQVDENKNIEQIKQVKQSISWTDFYKEIEKIPQAFYINCNKDTTIACLEGTTIKIQKNTFISEKTGKLISGTIEIKVTEYYKLSDMLLENLTTTSDGMPLETGGMLHISAIANNENCKIMEGKKIEIGFPSKSKKENMQLFNGSWDNDKLNWETVPNSTDLNTIYKNVNAQFPGGNNALIKFLRKNLHYPEKARELGIEGKVIVQFIVDRDGYVKHATVIKGLYTDCDEAAKKAILKLPKFIPAQINGEKVNSMLTLPITFSNSGILNTDNKNLNENFEKKYTDSTINNASIYDITSYLFSTSKLGWINVDRFIKEYAGLRSNLLVKLDKQDVFFDSNVKMIFQRFKSIMAADMFDNTYFFNSIPFGEQVTIVAIKKINNQPYLAIKEIVTTSKIEDDFIFKPVTMETLKTEMKVFDRMYE